MPKWDVDLPPLVMIRTFSARLRVLGRSLTGGVVRGVVRGSDGFSATPGSLVSEAGDTLIEVLISALLVGLIVVGTFSGLNSTNRATSIDRSRSQADALAQQDEDRLRSLPVSTLAKLEHTAETKNVKQNGTEYTVTSGANYVVDNAATTNCATTAPTAEYIETTSTVTWHALGTGKPVVETGIVSPPPDTSLIVQVTNQAGEPVPGMEAQVTGPTSATAFTSANGCTVLALSPGEYEINVKQTGFVDQNWIPETKTDSFYTKSVYLTAETTTKEKYLFAKAAQLKPLTFEELNPESGKSEAAKALNAVIESGEMSPPTRLIQKEGNATYLATMQTEKTIYPFTTGYTIYAGSCLANKPPLEKEWLSKKFVPEKEISGVLLLPSLIVDVWQGAKGEPKKPVTTAPEIFLSDTDENCESTYHQPETVIPTKEKVGALKYPGQPWGTYTVCVNVTHEGKKEHISALGQKNNNPKQEGTRVEMYEGGSSGTGLEPEPCP